LHLDGYYALLEVLATVYPLITRFGDLVHSVGGNLAGPAMFLVAVLDSSVLSIPEANDILIVGLSIGKAWSRVAYYVGLTAAGSIVGCLCLYAIGRHGGKSLIGRRISPARMAWMQTLYRKYGIFSLLVPCILPPPTPFKVFVLSAGVFGVSPPKFILAVGLGRLIRYSTWGILAFHYGDAVKRYMEANLETVGIILFSIIVAGMTAALIVFFARRRVRQSSFNRPSG
jgi:membrane protein YqaA with SNARE-associated domain